MHINNAVGTDVFQLSALMIKMFLISYAHARVLDGGGLLKRRYSVE